MLPDRRDALRYYRAISEYLLPHLHDRPVSFKRYPDALTGEFFWEKDAPSFTPKWVERFAVPRRSKGEEAIEYIVINDLRTLRWVVEAGGIEIHPFLHTIPRVDLATHVAFDLDPGEGADIVDCARVALLLRDALRGIHFESFAKVSGSKGIQVYVPLNSDVPHAVTEPFARMVADELARAHPDRIVSQMTKSLRRNKVFIDWSQNADFKTTVAVYSFRATRLVSMPVRWEELEKPRKLTWDADEAVARVKRVGDLWEQVLTMRQGLPGYEGWGVRGGGGSRKRSAPSSPRSPNPQLPKPKSQSGRRLFALAKNELLLEMGGRFQRWTLSKETATPAGEMEIDPAYYRGEIAVDDTGAYEVIEGRVASGRLRLWFSGRVMWGEWR